jgi:predicted restriction endonuclease
LVLPPLPVQKPPKVSEPGGLESPAGVPTRETIEVDRIIRDTKISKEIKELYKHRCQLCNYRIEFDNGQFYAEGHHIKPLGSPHIGPDERENVLCVCPNCHAKLDYGVIALDPKKINNDEVAHPIRKEYIDYHNTQIYNSRHLTSRSS